MSGRTSKRLAACKEPAAIEMNENSQDSRADELSLWLAASALRSSGESIQALVLDEIRRDTKAGVPLTEALKKLTQGERKPGDFGVAFVGPLLLPILLEGVKAFWTLYLTELQKKAFGELATMTIDAVKSTFRKALLSSEKPEIFGNLEQSLRDVAAAHHLSSEQTARLIALAQSPDLDNELDVGG